MLEPPSPLSRTGRRIKTWLAERQIIVLSGGRARYGRLTTRKQVAVFVAALTVVVAGGALGVQVARTIDGAKTRITVLADENERLAQVKRQVRAQRDTELRAGLVISAHARLLRGEVSRLESVLSRTGIGAADLIEALLSDLGEPVQSATNGGTLMGRVADLERASAKRERLLELMALLPLSKPTDRGWVSSNYGRRRNPFTGRFGMHHGIDISAPLKTPIYATAPGVVSFVGWRDYYGKLVEIDHGSGFKTRYGHLSKILVTHGQRVPYRHKVGLMGKSGRASGSHVHYEVEYLGKTRDPAPFFDAGLHVLR